MITIDGKENMIPYWNGETQGLYAAWLANESFTLNNGSILIKANEIYKAYPLVVGFYGGYRGIDFPTMLIDPTTNSADNPLATFRLEIRNINNRKIADIPMFRELKIPHNLSSYSWLDIINLNNQTVPVTLGFEAYSKQQNLDLLREQTGLTSDTINEVTSARIAMDNTIFESLSERLAYDFSLRFGKSVTDFGVVGDGVVDDTQALQAAVDSLVAGETLYIPVIHNNHFFNMRITETITLVAKNSVSIVGSNGNSYGMTYPRITWNGSGNTIIRMINCSSDKLSGFFVYMADASIAIDVDQDNDRVINVTVSSGSKNITSSNARFKTDAVGYLATDIGREITMGDFTTTIASITDSSHAVLSFSSPQDFTNAEATMSSPHQNSTSSSCIFERLIISKPNSDDSTVGLRISNWSANNNERHKIEDVSVFFGGNNGSMTDKGKAFQIGSPTVGGGLNAFNIVFINPYWFGASIGIETQTAEYMTINGESNFTTLDHKPSGGKIHLINHRTESERQFLSAFATQIKIDSLTLGNGSWDTAYPLIYLDGSSKLVLSNLMSDEQEDIVLLDANPSNNNKLITDIDFTSTSLIVNVNNFTAGIVSLGVGTTVGLYLGSPDTVGSSIQMKGTTFANLAFMYSTKLTTNGNGTMVYCRDCQKTNPCVGGGNGAFAKRSNGSWDCA